MSPAASPVERAADEGALLALPLRRLGLRVEGTPLGERVEALHAELAARGLHLPHAWLSTSFFSPDGVPGIGLPFYLAHPRLLRLERRRVHQAEGARHGECMRLLRHEAGHALDTAYQLFRRPDWRRAFGLRSAPYRRTYGCDPGSRAFVRHLPRWYAQSHPAEDFAETFAVWLGTRDWRRRYRDWPALAKLEVVDRMMDEVAGTRPLRRSRERTDALAGLGDTLGRHYARLTQRQLAEPELPLDRLAWRRHAGPDTVRAAAWLRSARAELEAEVRRSGRHDAYAARQVFDLLALRARQHDARWSTATTVPPVARSLAMTLRALAGGRVTLAR